MIYIGIDPGVNTGFAAWDSINRNFLVIDSTSIIKAMSRLLAWKKDSDDLFLIIEDARKRGAARGDKMSDAKKQGVGSVKRDSAIWQEFCKHYEFKYLMRSPGNTKMTTAQFKALTQYQRRTNNHGRDAAMIVFGMHQNAWKNLNLKQLVLDKKLVK